MSQPQVFGGRYELVRHIARGGMAQVYLAQDVLLDRPVALKVLFPELSVSNSFVERFRREAKAAANLTHPNIVSIYDWGQGEQTYYIVMEYVDGPTLSSLLRQGPLDSARAASIAADVAAALEFAHRRGVIHRDVKPGNVLLDETGRVRVADFGIARAVGASEDLTQTGSVMGTATYFSPEQAQGHPVDPRSDVYSLGVVLYEMLTGRPPFSGDSPVSIAYKHVREEPVPPSAVNPAVPASIEAVVMKALAKDPADRYQTAEDLRADLLRYGQGQPVSAASAAQATRMLTGLGAAGAGYAAGPGADPTRVQSAAGATMTMPSAAGGYGGVAGPPPDEPHSRRAAVAWLSVAVLIALIAAGFFGGRQLGWWGTSAKTLTVPADIAHNKTAAAAQSELTGLGFTDVQRRAQQSSTVPLGYVITTDPKPGSRTKSNDSVVLIVSAGHAPIAVPAVVGHTEAYATRVLQGDGFKVKSDTQNSTVVKAGTVISTNPPSGVKSPFGSRVTVVVSAGAKQVTIPSVVGDDPSTAGQQLGALNLVVKQVTEASTTVGAGYVTRTSPAAETPVAVGSTVTVYVSTGPPQVTVPDLTGKTKSQANSALLGQGLVPHFTTQPVSDPSQDGVVISQSPAGGLPGEQGQTVTVVIGSYNAPSTTTSTTTAAGETSTTT